MTMPLATLIFSGRNWFGFALGILAVAAVLLFWNYRAAPRGPVRWLCGGLKILGLCALGFCLLEPLWSGQRAKPGANLFAIVADNSQGLQIKDRGATRSRGEFLRDLLNPQNSRWLGTLEENFELRRYFFDARLQTTKDFSELAFDGRASAIGSALRTVAERYHGLPLSGVLLLTDGNATDLRDAPDLPGLPPVYPVVIGNSDPIKDISVEQVHSTQTDFEDAPVSVQADVSATGFGGDAIVAQLLDASGKPVAEQTLRARRAQDTLAFRFQLKPEKPGLSFYRVNVRARSELASANTPAKTEEATLENNDDILAVDRGHGPYRILYVSGRPNWDFKFLNRAIQEDTQVELVALIRVARREPKFNFLGRAGETSNPLYRGFGNQSPEEVERYDQPVLARLYPNDDAKERYDPDLRGGFPKLPEALYGFHAVILGDLEAEFFTPDQQTLLQKFVSERGGGLLMLGGAESLAEGKYDRTPIGEMLPVYLDRPQEIKPSGPLQLHLELTREGLLQPWARLRDNEADEKARWREMAPLMVLNRVREPKPGASVIGTAVDADGRSYPALVTQRFGHGRTAVLTIADLFHWGLHDADAHKDMDKAWRQMVRWLVSNVPNRVELAAEPQAGDADGAIRLQVRVRDPKFQPLDNATVNLQVQQVMAEDGRPQTNSAHLQVDPSGSEPGLYEAVYVPHTAGGYQATVCVTNTEGAEVGRAVAGWSTDLATEEFRSLTPNVALLEAIARKTGGEVIPASRLHQFALNLPHRLAPVMESWTTPFWHTPALFGFALACFVAEWGLRRWKGMP